MLLPARPLRAGIKKVEKLSWVSNHSNRSPSELSHYCVNWKSKRPLETQERNHFKDCILVSRPTGSFPHRFRTAKFPRMRLAILISMYHPWCQRELYTFLIAD